jgi:hypothetical protein
MGFVGVCMVLKGYSRRRRCNQRHPKVNDPRISAPTRLPTL